MKLTVTLVCAVAGAILLAALVIALLPDSKTPSSYDPSPVIATGGTASPLPFRSPTPTPYKTTTPTPTPAPSASPTPQLVRDPASGLREDVIRQDMLAVDKAITYEKLKKNADQYDSQPWTFSGKVFQIQESGGRTAALVSLDSWGSKKMWVTANFTTEFVEKDQVYVVGYLAGNYSYTSIAGWNITVPAIEARAILKPAEAARIRAGKPPSKK